MTGETQLRAKRTRIKILRAIADRKGNAGFSDIKVTTGLSTGSIYYHLERMRSYVTKDSKHYIITEEGLRLLGEADSRYRKTPPAHRKEESSHEHPDEGRWVDHNETEAPAAPRGFSKFQRVVILGGLALLGTVGTLYLNTWGNLALFTLGGNATAILFVVLVAGLTVFFSFWSRRGLVPQIIGYRGVMFSILSTSVVISGIMFLSAPFLVTAAPHYDNSMDALLSSYSLHWQVR